MSIKDKMKGAEEREDFLKRDAKLVYSRVLGHSGDIKHSEKWR